jgi:hypothetical protein
MKNTLNILLIASILLLFMGCKKYEFRWVDKMAGVWQIENFTLTEIDSSGNVTTLIDKDNAGTMEFSQSYIDGLKLEGIFDYKRTLNVDGTNVLTEGTGTIDEEGTRLIFYGGYCIQCDSMYTIDVNKKNKLVYSQFKVQSPWTKTRKTQMTLKR